MACQIGPEQMFDLGIQMCSFAGVLWHRYDCLTMLCPECDKKGSRSLLGYCTKHYKEKYIDIKSGGKLPLPIPVYSKKIKSVRSEREENFPTYRCWVDMWSRCRNPNTTQWKYYGGRGIRVCEHWTSFHNFLMDMGPRPKGYVLDRMNNNGNYEPSNCQWVTKSESNRNRRNIVEILFDNGRLDNFNRKVY